MRRRDFMLAASAAIAWPIGSRAEEIVRRIGFLSGGVAQAHGPEAAFTQALGELGWIDGKNLRVDYRFAGGSAESAHQFARELIATNPDVIYATANLSVAAILQETHTIPVVFSSVADPVKNGFVESLAHPGRNATGLTNYEPSIAGKWLELIKELAPGIEHVGILYNPDTFALFTAYWQALDVAAAQYRVRVSAAPAHDMAAFSETVLALGRELTSGAIVLPDGYTVTHRDEIIGILSHDRLPAIFGLSDFTAAGGLASYGVDTASQYRQAASYVDHILRGAKPGDLPVEAPNKFDLVINLKAASAIGLNVPPSLLARADQVIE